MVKVKINGTRWPDEEKYIGGTYDAFKLTHDDGGVDYAVQVNEDVLIFVPSDKCEIIEENVSTIKVKINKVEWPEEEQYLGHTCEAFEMIFSDGRHEYATHVDADRIIGIKPENCDVISAVEEGRLAAIEEQTVEPTKKILLVEDGSVDVDELDAWCDQNGIKMIVYRQGANKPEFLNI